MDMLLGNISEELKHSESSVDSFDRAIKYILSIENAFLSFKESLNPLLFEKIEADNSGVRDYKITELENLINETKILFEEKFKLINCDLKNKYYNDIFKLPEKILRETRKNNIEFAEEYIRKYMTIGKIVHIKRNINNTNFENMLEIKSFVPLVCDAYKDTPHKNMNINEFLLLSLNKIIFNDFLPNITHAVHENINKNMNITFEQIVLLRDKLNIVEYERSLNHDYFKNPSIENIIELAKKHNHIKYLINDTFVMDSYQEYINQFKPKYILVDVEIILEFTDDIYNPIKFSYIENKIECDNIKIDHVIKYNQENKKIYEELYTNYKNTHHDTILRRIINNMIYVINGVNNNLEILVNKKLINKYTIEPLNIVFYGDEKSLLRFINFDALSEKSYELEFSKMFRNATALGYINGNLANIIFDLVTNNIKRNYIVNEIERMMCSMILSNIIPYEANEEFMIDIVDKVIEFNDEKYSDEKDSDEIRTIQYIDLIEKDYEKFNSIPKEYVNNRLQKKYYYEMIRTDYTKINKIPSKFYTYELGIIYINSANSDEARSNKYIKKQLKKLEDSPESEYIRDFYLGVFIANNEYLDCIPKQYQTYDWFLKAVELGKISIEFVPYYHHTFELCTLGVNNHMPELQNVMNESVTIDICKLLVVNKPEIIKYINEDFINDNIYFELVELNSIALEYLDEKTQKRIKHMLKIKEFAENIIDILVKDITYEMAILTIKNMNGFSDEDVESILDHIPKKFKTKEFYKELVKNHNNGILFLSEEMQTEKFYTKMIPFIKFNNIPKIPFLSREFYIKFVQHDINSVPYILNIPNMSEARRTRLLIEAVKNSYMLKDVRYDDRDEEICLEAVLNNENNMAYVPEYFVEEIKKIICKLKHNANLDKSDNKFNESAMESDNSDSDD